jgi:hypothetical protein
MKLLIMQFLFVFTPANISNLLIYTELVGVKVNALDSY